METQKIINYLKAVCEIPRASKDEQKMAEYLMAFAKERGHEAVQDEKGNVVVKVAAVGCEGKEPVILQGHLDMVYVKSEESNHEYQNGIVVKEDEEYLFADGTSLGADNGVALAYCMMLMDSKDVVHPDLEMIFTVEEEVGLAGAGALDVSDLKGRYFLNIDGEEEGVFYSSCAGAVRAGTYWNIERETLAEGRKGLVIEISGLKGGHSGINISDNRANAIQLAGRILYTLNQVCDYRLGEFQIPGKANAIPSRAKLPVYVDAAQVELVKETVAALEKDFQNEYEVTDIINISVVEKEVEEAVSVYTKELTTNIAKAIMLVPNAVMSMSEKVEGLVETSMNMGFVEEQGDRLFMLSSVRSAVDSKKYFIRDKMQIIADAFCDEIVFENDYPGWQYVEESPLRTLASEAYKKLSGKEAKVEAIHAGLECGYWYNKNPKFDLISFGPNLYDVHSIKEKVSKKSIAFTWEFIKEILKSV